MNGEVGKQEMRERPSRSTWGEAGAREGLWTSKSMTDGKDYEHSWGKCRTWTTLDRQE